MARETEQIATTLKKKRVKEEDMTFERSDYLSSGSTLLNLACTGRTYGAFLKGFFYLFVGDSESGKTWNALTCLAEASISKYFDDYDLIYDNPENGALMNMRRYFGNKVADRLRAPGEDKDGNPMFSEYVEDFYFNLDDANKRGTPYIYILDSMDSLEAKDDEKHFAKAKTARRKGAKSGGTYGMAKAKLNSNYLRKVISGARKTKSIIIIICQSRDLVGGMPTFGGPQKTRAGGKALKFYASLEIWTSVKEKIKKLIKGKNRQIGMVAKAQVKKNRIQGKDRTVNIPLYQSSGIDDIGGMIDWLAQEGHWRGAKGDDDGKGSSIWKGGSAPEFKFHGKREDLVKKIEEEDLEKDLRALVRKVWGEIESACAVPRKKRYL